MIQPFYASEKTSGSENCTKTLYVSDEEESSPGASVEKEAFSPCTCATRHRIYVRRFDFAVDGTGAGGAGAIVRRVGVAQAAACRAGVRRMDASKPAAGGAGGRAPRTLSERSPYKLDVKIAYPSSREPADVLEMHGLEIKDPDIMRHIAQHGLKLEALHAYLMQTKANQTLMPAEEYERKLANVKRELIAQAGFLTNQNNLFAYLLLNGNVAQLDADIQAFKSLAEKYKEISHEEIKLPEFVYVGACRNANIHTVWEPYFMSNSYLCAQYELDPVRAMELEQEVIFFTSPDVYRALAGLEGKIVSGDINSADKEALASVACTCNHDVTKMVYIRQFGIAEGVGRWKELMQRIEHVMIAMGMEEKFDNLPSMSFCIPDRNKHELLKHFKEAEKIVFRKIAEEKRVALRIARLKERAVSPDCAPYDSSVEVAAVAALGTRGVLAMARAAERMARFKDRTISPERMA